MSPELARGEITVGEVCERERPDAIFLPHRNYVRLNDQLKGSGCLDDYVKVVKRSSSPLHVRKDLLETYRCGGKP